MNTGDGAMVSVDIWVLEVRRKWTGIGMPHYVKHGYVENANSYQCRNCCCDSTDVSIVIVMQRLR